MSNLASNATVARSKVADDRMSEAQIIALAQKHSLPWPNDPAYIAFARELLEKSRTVASA